MKPFNNMSLLGLCKFDPGDVILASSCPETPPVEIPKPWKRSGRGEYNEKTEMENTRKREEREGEEKNRKGTIKGGK
jgi:hypothetical protein